ncbi:bacteriohemerythrin [Desulfonema magnum]|uniref:Bacteriaohemerythrin n=1 Tax=Desulfonema magnum TaxID=45655 RepID=A0A975GSP6_9BACT|nr:bacteriohemerythrin [Desulfonema magnum]QTA92127.1 Bacteriaohemerythrin [Desulfonema magnum]
MPLIEWKKDFSVGVAVLDSHHRKLISLVNKLHDAMKNGKAKGVISGIISELDDYTKYHFREEEKLMEKIRYPGLNEHKKAHEYFTAAVKKYKAEADKGQAAFLSVGISVLLTDWLKNHIGMMDKKYQKDMNANGIR